jgi:hypothetical protein
MIRKPNLQSRTMNNEGSTRHMLGGNDTDGLGESYKPTSSEANFPGRCAFCRRRLSNQYN